MTDKSPTRLAIRDLSVLAYANRFTLWHYKARSETLAKVTAPHFFDEATTMLSEGDMIMISAADGGRVVIVSHASDDLVTVSPLA